jgi:hypothetical protein
MVNWNEHSAHPLLLPEELMAAALSLAERSTEGECRSASPPN